MDDILSKVGTLLDAHCERDAVHIAMMSVKAGERLKPGQRIGFIMGDFEHVGESSDPCGIVDPYLGDDVEIGQIFLMFMFPGSIVSIRHHWEHPAFNNEARAWMEDFVSHINDEANEWVSRHFELTVDEVLDIARKCLEDDDFYSYCLPFDTPDRCFTDIEQFWKCFEILTGKKVVDKEVTIFRCAC